MSHFFGVYKDIKELNIGNVTELGIYEGIFSTIYANMQDTFRELNYYIENGLCTGKRVLEIACGDGGNYMIPMAKKGFEVDGVEISESMIERFHEQTARLPEKIKSRMNIYQANIFEYDTDEKYDLITIPSTTICLLADDEEQTRCLFQKVYKWLKPGGRFMFDYRIDQSLQNEFISHIYTETNKKYPYVLFMQEFNNVVPGRGIVNMYVETMEDGVDKRYIASSDKRIITDGLVERLLEGIDFRLHNSYTVDLTNAKVKLLVLEKEEENE
ncbi:MAG: methyltransferase [Lachnospiraceae bacterium]|nr:methyltransferase [Lachnospiraceae bacterium]